MANLFRVHFMALLLLFGGCATVSQPPVTPPPTTPPVTVVTPNLQPADWSALPGWYDDQLSAAWDSWLLSCTALKSKPDWQTVCAVAVDLKPVNNDTVRAYFQTWFNVYQSLQMDGKAEGLMTGYYEPLLHGNRTQTADYPIPLYAVPADLLTIDLSSVYPELKNMRLRGRLQGNKVIPYLSRADIDSPNMPLAGQELLWVDNAVEAFFLQIQGSGRVQLPDGSMVRVGYADQNGYPYRSIGRVLADRGELRLDQTSMQGIKAWGKQNPDKLPELLAQNPSFVFFKEIPGNNGGPFGALGVPLTDRRSIAIDIRAMPLGAPVWLATTEPATTVAMNRLVMAQDTGGAIRGNVRTDFFWGFGDAAGKQAGMMKQPGRMWVLLPKTMTVPGTMVNR